MESSQNTKILLATGNPAKQQTLRWLLEGLPLAAITPEEVGVSSDPEEEGESHQEIARSKAKEWSLASSMLVIASDGGLVIPALGGNWESRFTHRFAGPAADDQERLKQLLDMMTPYHGADREASWIEALAIADQGNVLASWELSGSTGRIARQRGGAPEVPGFWVFSVWHFTEFDKVYNELSSAEKESLDDHWTRLKQLVQDFFNTSQLTSA